MAIESVVVADDEFLNRDLLTEIFTRMDIDVRAEKDGLHALRALEERPADLVITDIRMPGMGGMRLLAKVREKWPHIPVVMMTAFASVESAVQSMRDGAYDYLMKPFGVEQVESLLLRLEERQQLIRQVAILKEEVRDRHQARNFLGETQIMRDVFETISRAAKANATVLVRGESGTGKELVARALHEQSPRAEGPFIKVNCAALTESLLASELFGHEKGSFTGAEAQRIGRFELADGGTLLLDEISEISPEMQAKLLRILEEREFERVGGEKTISVDVRIIATTNRDLQHEVEAGNFREDLYYRLNVIPIQLPPLRERKGDVAAIIEHYLAHFGKELGIDVQLDDQARQALVAYGWPGNVRELVNIVERLVVLGGGGTLDIATISRCLPEAGGSPAVSSGQGTDAADLSLDAVQRAHVIAVLERHDHDKKPAAKALGITQKALTSLMDKLEIPAAS